MATARTGSHGGSTPLLPLRRLWLVLLSYAAQYVVIHAVPRTAVWEPWRAGLILLASLPLVPWLWLNRRWRGVWIIGFGLTLNLLVMVANRGFMPIDPGTLARAGLGGQLATTTLGQALPNSKDILLLPAATHLAFLRDWIVLGGPSVFGRVVSPGDIALFAGLLVTAVEVLCWLVRQPQRGTEVASAMRSR
jgi:hypothetical protein